MGSVKLGIANGGNPEEMFGVKVRGRLFAGRDMSVTAKAIRLLRMTTTAFRAEQFTVL